MRYRRDFGTQVVDAGRQIGGLTGTILMFAGMFLGLIIAILQLTLLAWFSSIFFGNAVWWIYWGILAFIAYRVILGHQNRKESTTNPADQPTE